ncbi:MAG: hypothetical protein N2D54_05980, partial [Chloroflexota bacterium]
MKSRLANFQPDKLILVYILLNLILGFFIVGDYGESWDEASRLSHGKISIRFYKTFDINAEPDAFGEPNVRPHGPFFIMSSAAVVKIVQSVFSNLDTTIILHSLYYLVFQLAIFSFYHISKRFMNSWVALSTAVVFGTQPLFFGHAFINPKDIPFLGFFLFSLYRGLVMIEDYQKDEKDVDNLTFGELVEEDWKAMPPRSSASLNIFRLLWLAFTLFVTLGRERLSDLLAKMVNTIYFQGS